MEIGFMKDIELNKGNESSRFPVLKSQKVGDCFIRVTLDTRHASREGKLPVAICFHQQGKKWYYHLDMKLTGDEFINVCKATVKGKVDFPQIGLEKGTTERGIPKVSKSCQHYKFLSIF